MVDNIKYKFSTCLNLVQCVVSFYRDTWTRHKAGPNIVIDPNHVSSCHQDLCHCCKSYYSHSIIVPFYSILPLYPIVPFYPVVPVFSIVAIVDNYHHHIIPSPANLLLPRVSPCNCPESTCDKRLPFSSYQP